MDIAILITLEIYGDSFRACKERLKKDKKLLGKGIADEIRFLFDGTFTKDDFSIRCHSSTYRASVKITVKNIALVPVFYHDIYPHLILKYAGG